MDTIGVILLLLIILLLFVGVISLIALIVMAIAKKRLKVPGILTGVSFGSAIFFFVVMLIVGVIATTGENANTASQNNNTSNSSNISTSNKNDDEDMQSSDVTLTEYNEADLDKLHNNEYNKQSKLKVTNAEVISVTLSDESSGNNVGNMVVAQVDDIPVIIHDMIGYDFEIGDVHTFYGSPNMEDGMTLVEYEESDIKTNESPGVAKAGIEKNTGLSIGDTVDIGGVVFTIHDSYYTDERNSMSDKVVDQVLMIDMDFTNNTGRDYSPIFGINVYADGKKVDTYPVGDISLDRVSDGRSADGSLAYAIIGNPNEIELEFSPMTSTSGEKEIFNVTPK